MSFVSASIKYGLTRARIKAIVDLFSRREKYRLSMGNIVDELPTRYITIFKNHNIYTLNDLLSKTDKDLLSMKGINFISLEHIKKAIKLENNRSCQSQGL